MSIGLILLAAISVLILFGVAQRVLDKMQLTDRAALLITAAIFFGSLLPDIRIGRVVFNIGGGLIPLGICAWLLIKTDTKKEVIRALLGSVLTGGIVFLLSRVMPNEPEEIIIDPNYVYGIVGGLAAYILGRSRRAAFICGVLGVVLADIAVAVANWAQGMDQSLILGGAGAMDVVVISGLLAVLLCELLGEVIERMARSKERVNHDPVATPVRKEEKR